MSVDVQAFANVGHSAVVLVVVNTASDVLHCHKLVRVMTHCLEGQIDGGS